MPQEMLDEDTRKFFSKPASEVVAKIAERYYLADQKIKDAVPGKAKDLIIPTDEGERTFRILLAQAYAENDANQTWKGTRIQEIRSLTPGEIIAYGTRAGVLPFIKTIDGDNILLRVLEDIATKEKVETATAIAKILGLKHKNVGRLKLIDDRLKFERVGA